jgi:hypothetical protein
MHIEVKAINVKVRSVSRGYAKLITASRCCNQDSEEETREGVDKMLTDGSGQAAEPEEDQNEGAQNAGGGEWRVGVFLVVTCAALIWRRCKNP